jgi:hypothetical protein
MYISSTIWPAVNVARMLRSESCDFIYTFLWRVNRLNMVSCAVSRLNLRNSKRESPPMDGAVRADCINIVC